MRRKLIAALAALTAAFGLAFAAAPAQASTGGTADGDTHGSVALIVFYTAEGRFRCSGALVSPTVVLTAAHCTDGTIGKTLVTFNSVIAEQSPAGFPDANPSVGYTSADLAGRISGTAQTDPGFSNFTDKNNWNDVGIIKLDTPVSQPFYSLAAPGALDAIAPGDVPKTVVTAVGYGAELAKPDSGPQRRVPVSYPMIRRSVDMNLQSVGPQIFTTHANVNPAQGTGGICSGDSGGPIFLGDQIVGLTSFGNKNCLALDGLQRVDVASIQSWITSMEGTTAAS
ncbi:trypsin-like serine protease [Sinomonas humi]|uniref:Pterin-4-alpha-carbinolamine dehydratase n=1 Tax=Sinomonas humi TaxID=1338436 RepID=A0A0B2ALX9_9MICC|nr:trypsin-like serine protease [Sinomonas humi]KHL04366.1 pterin-4-alpha-carbinolamine dehydratase [Sinomonas humi]